jgi:hypothetical protein
MLIWKLVEVWTVAEVGIRFERFVIGNAPKAMRVEK